MKPRLHTILKSKTNPFRSTTINGAAIVFACFTLLNPCAQAADQLWIGSAGDHNVTTTSNWVGGAPVLDQWAPFVFGSDVVDGYANLDRWVAISSITLTSGLTRDITIDNGPIVTGGSLVDMSSAGANLTLNAQVQQAWGDMTFNVGAGRTLTAAGGVGESGWFGLHTGLTKNGAGTVVLGGASTYTLDTFINAGTLEIGGAGTLGGGSYAGTITNNGAFVHSSSAHQTLAAIGGNGSITQSGTGTLTIAGWGAGNGGTITVNSGTLEMPDGSWQQESHNIVVNGGTLSTSDGNSRALSWTLNGGTVSSRGDASPTFWGNMMLYDNQAVTVGGAAVSTISSHVMLGTGSEFAVGAGSTLNVTGALSNSVWAGGGSGSFIKTGAGTLTLTGANTYTGTTTVNGGTLELNNAIGTIIYTGGNIAINNGATLTFSGGNQYWFDGKTVAFGAGGGTFDTGTGMNLVSGANPTGGSGFLFTTTGGTTSTISGSSGINANGNTETFDVTSTSNLNLTSFVWNSGNVIKQGGGTLTMSGANAYTGTTTVNSGLLVYSNAAAVGSTSGITVNGAYGSGGHLRFDSGTDGGTISTPISLIGGDFDWNMSVNVPTSLTFTGPINLSGSPLIVSEGANSTLNFTNGFHGTDGLGLTFAALSGGKNFFVLSGASDFTGDFIIVNWAGSPQVTLSGGDNRLPTTAVVRVTGSTGSPGALDLNGNNQTIAGLADSLGFGGNDAGARHVVNTSGTAVILTLNTTSNQSSSVTIGGTDINGTTGNNLALVKSGGATQTLSGANTYTGGTTISGGTLKVASPTALGGNSGAVSVASGAVLDLNGTTMTGTNALTLNGTGISSGGALVNSSGTAGTYAGNVTLGSASSIGGTGGVTLSGTLNLAGHTLIVKNSGTVNLNGAPVTASNGTLDTEAGTTNVNAAIGTGSSVVYANATTNFTTSQTLGALNIGVADPNPNTLAPAFTGGASTAAAPEPGSLSLLLVGALGIAARRRRSA